MTTHIRSKLSSQAKIAHKFAGPKPIPKPIPNRYPTQWPPRRIQPAALQPSLELPKCTLCTTFVLKILLALKSCDFRAGAASILLKSCDFPAGAAKMYFAYYTCTEKLRLPSWSWKLAECTSQTTLVRKVTTFELELPKHCRPMQRKKPILTDTRA